MADYPVMQTPDGAWRVEVYRRSPSKTFWYRLIHGDNVIEDLSIGGVQRLLAQADIDLADLVDAA